MGLISFSKVERDFPGGIYLPPLGDCAPAHQIESLDYRGDLLIPLQVAAVPAMRPILPEGASVRKSELLARNDHGHRLYAPRSGIVGPVGLTTIRGQTRQSALLLRCPAAPEAAVPLRSGLQPAHPERTTNHTGAKHEILQNIEDAGIVIPHTGRPLAQLLRHFENRKVGIVVANATPLEPELNTPLAILSHWPSEVFAGLAILKTFFDAHQAVMAYPYHFPIDNAAAAIWQVRCVAVSEKYPQGRSGSVLRTLRKQGHLPRRQAAQTILVFDVQLLRQVERAVLAADMPTERIVTVAGDGVAHPVNLLAPLGLPVTELLKQAQCYDDTTAIIDGTSMAGVSIDPADSVVCQGSQYFSAVRTIHRPPPQRCIRCGWCVRHCPAKIDPARLLQFAETGQYQRAAAIGIHRCLSCGICTYLCPSSLRIMDQIIMVRRKLRASRPQEQP